MRGFLVQPDWAQGSFVVLGLLRAPRATRALKGRI
jgi:hypothetical protein